MSESRFRLVSDLEMEMEPVTDDLVAGAIPARSLVTLYGQSATGKSFVALDLAFCVATGRPWLGRFAVKTPGPVVYVIAEGDGRFRDRVRAWRLAHGITDCADVHFVRTSVQLADGGEVDELLSAIIARGIKPVLVIIDTLARCAVGIQENDAADMGRVVAGLDRICKATDATVLSVHHAGKTRGDEERGSGALRAAVDTSILLRLQTSGRFLSFEKQKDGAAPGSVRFELRTIDLGEERSSCVIELLGDGSAAVPKGRAPAPPSTELNVLRGFLSGASHKDWRAACEAINISAATFDRHREGLLRAGDVRKVGRLYHANSPEPEQRPRSHGLTSVSSAPIETASTLMVSAVSPPLGGDREIEGKTDAEPYDGAPR